MSSKKFPVLNPATEEVICHVEEGDKVNFPTPTGVFVSHRYELTHYEFNERHENMAAWVLAKCSVVQHFSFVKDMAQCTKYLLYKSEGLS